MSGQRLRLTIAGLVIAAFVILGSWLARQEYRFRHIAAHSDFETAINYWQALDRDDAAKRLRFIELMVASGHHGSNSFLRQMQIGLRLDLGRHEEALALALDYMDDVESPPRGDGWEFDPTEFASTALLIAHDLDSATQIRVLGRIEDRLSQWGEFDGIAWVLYEVAHTYLSLGDTESALRVANNIPTENASRILEQGILALQAKIAAAQDRWRDAEGFYSAVEQQVFPRSYQNGVGTPEITRSVIMRDLEGIDYQHGEPSYPLGYWTEARFGVLEARDAQHRCEGQLPSLEELETALSYRIEEIARSLQGAELIDRSAFDAEMHDPSQWTLMYRRDMTIALMRRAAVREGLGLNYFSQMDRGRAEYFLGQLGEDLRFEIRHGFPNCSAPG